MPWSNNIMTAPLSIANIAEALGSTSLDLGTLVQDTRGLCNIWARYKPITSSRVGYVRESDRQAANFGLSSQEYSTPQLAAGSNGWTYSPPLSGYYRMFDYVKVTDAGVPSTTVGYTKNEVAPCRGFYSGESGDQLTHYVYNTGAQREDDINFYAINAGNDYGIGFAEMGGLADWYIGIAVVVTKNNTTKTYIVTSTQKIGEGMNGGTAWQTVPIPKDDTIFDRSHNVTYGAFALLCNVGEDGPITEWTDYTTAVAHGSAKFMPLPLTNPFTANFDFEVFTGTFSAWVGGAYRLTSGDPQTRRKVWYSLYGSNNTGQDIPSSYLTIELELYAYANGVRESIQTKTYTQYTTPSSAIPVGNNVFLDGGVDVTMGGLAVQSAPLGSLHIDVTGRDMNYTTLFTSTTQVADDPQPIIDI